METVLLYNHAQSSDFRIAEGGVCQTLAAYMGAGGNNTPMVMERKDRNDMYKVRRLTPKECERLQGFPDDWTSIGDWVDSKGKTRKTSDANRYKALGNSIAIPQHHWYLQKLRPYIGDNPTLGSLFDGIGGFPIAFEDIYGKGSARWASEIEDFCIAVTKKHFPEMEEEELEEWMN